MLNTLFSFKGRINRLRYWLYNIGYLFVVAIPLIVLDIMVKNLMASDSEVSFSALFVIILIQVLLMYIPFALMAKRWHDLGKSGWYSLLGIIPFVAIVIGFIKGNDGSNEYGDDPLMGTYKFCTNCGTKLSKKGSFCQNCGHSQ